MGIADKLQDLDEAILDGFYQKKSDKIEDRWGISCFRLAWYVEWSVVAFLSSLAVLWYVTGWPKLGIVMLFWFGSTSLVQMSRLQRLDASRDQFVKYGLMNPERRFWWAGFSRIIFAIIGTLMGTGLFIHGVSSVIVGAFSWADWPDFMFLALFFASSSGGYLAACTPRPKNPLRAGNELALVAIPAR